MICVVAAVALLSSWPQGGVAPACPCVDPFALGLLLNNNTPRASIDGCDIERSSDRRCYSFTYGAGRCAAHDEKIDPACNADPPTWCTSKWCYVDPLNCNRPFEYSTYFKSARLPTQEASSGAPASSSPASTRLAMSYQTCGYLDTYTSSTNGGADSLRSFTASQPGGALRVGFPGDSSSGYTLVSSASRYPAGLKKGQLKLQPGEGVQGTNRSGSVVVFLADILEKLKVPWVEVPISQRSRDFSPSSSFTACVHDVAIGHVDMCWANFWSTSSRLKMASFSSVMYNDQFYVIVPITSGTPSLMDSILKPFAPFSIELWFVVVLVFALVGVNLTVENQEGKIVWWDFVCSTLPTAVLDARAHPRRHTMRNMPTAHHPVRAHSSRPADRTRSARTACIYASDAQGLERLQPR